MKISTLKDYVIYPTLNDADLYLYGKYNINLNLCSKNSITLLASVAAHESNAGLYFKQINGPALSPYQMEPNTAIDIETNFLAFNSKLKELRDRYYNDHFGIEVNLVSNLFYSTFMARMHFYRVKENLPDSSNIHSIANYWKKYYNTSLGKGKVGDFIVSHKKYVINNEV